MSDVDAGVEAITPRIFSVGIVKCPNRFVVSRIIDAFDNPHHPCACVCIFLRAYGDSLTL